MTGMQRKMRVADPELTPLRQEARDKFVEALNDAYPDPEDSIRQQVVPMFEQWWPGTVPGPDETKVNERK